MQVQSGSGDKEASPPASLKSDDDEELSPKPQRPSPAEKRLINIDEDEEAEDDESDEGNEGEEAEGEADEDKGAP